MDCKNQFFYMKYGSVEGESQKKDPEHTETSRNMINSKTIMHFETVLLSCDNFFLK